MSFNTFAAGFCESELDSIAAAAIKKSGVNTDETFSFEVLPLKPEQLVEERLSTFAVLGSDQTGPTHWIDENKLNSWKIASLPRKEDLSWRDRFLDHLMITRETAGDAAWKLIEQEVDLFLKQALELK